MDGGASVRLDGRGDAAFLGVGKDQRRPTRAVIRVCASGRTIGDQNDDVGKEGGPWLTTQRDTADNIRVEVARGQAGCVEVAEHKVLGRPARAGVEPNLDPGPA